MPRSIVLVSHLGLAHGMKSAVDFIVGEEKDFHCAELDDRGIVYFKREVTKILNEISTEEEIILLSDLPSGSPGTNALSVLSEHRKVTLISGMNLPLVVDLVLMKDIKPLDELIEDAIASAQTAIDIILYNSLEEEKEDDF